MKELSEISKVFINAPVEAQSQIVDKVFETISYSNPLASECEHINQIQIRKCPRCGATEIILNGKRKEFPKSTISRFRQLLTGDKKS